MTNIEMETVKKVAELPYAWECLENKRILNFWRNWIYWVLLDRCTALPRPSLRKSYPCNFTLKTGWKLR